MTSFLYPFLDETEADAGALLDDLAASATAKWTESAELCAETVRRQTATLAAIATDVAARVRNGGTVFAIGNGGSATDAGALALRWASPATGRAIRTRSLADDPAVLTALANDVGVANIFTRQLMAHGREGDVVLAFSTSGGSDNVIAALASARARGILAVGVAGYDGGRMAEMDLDHLLVVASQSVHRVQEAQAALADALWREVQRELDAP